LPFGKIEREEGHGRFEARVVGVGAAPIHVEDGAAQTAHGEILAAESIHGGGTALGLAAHRIGERNGDGGQGGREP